MTDLDDLAAAEALEHEGDCCHEDDRTSVDATSHRFCRCLHPYSAHRIDLQRQSCDTGGCDCKGYVWCHDVTTTRTTTITRRTRETA